MGAIFAKFQNCLIFRVLAFCMEQVYLTYSVILGMVLAIIILILITKGRPFWAFCFLK